MSGPPADGGALGRQIAWNSLLGYAARLISILGWTVVTPWLLHALGAQRFGLWSLLTVISGMYLTFDFGLQGGVTKFVAELRAARRPEELRATIGMALVLYTVLSLGGLLIVSFGRDGVVGFFRIAPALRSEAGRALLGAGFAYALLNYSQLGGGLLAGLHRLDLWNRISIGVTLVQLGAIVVVIRSGGGVPSLLVVSGGATLLSAAACAWVVHRIAPGTSPALAGWSGERWRSLTRYSAALQIINAGLLVQFQLDKVLFGRFVGLAAVAHYELAYRVALSFWSIPALLLPPLLPAIAHLDALGDRERIARLYRRATRYVLASALPLAAGLVALSRPLFAAWLGHPEPEAARACAVLGVLLSVNILTGVTSAIVRGVGRPGLEAEYFVIATLVHVPLSLWLVPRLGFDGGLVALLVSGVIGSGVFIVRSHRFLREPLAPFLTRFALPPFAVSAVFAAGGGALAAAMLVGGPASRLRFLGALAAGAAILAVGAGGTLIAGRYVEPRELLDLLRRRPAGVEAAGL